MEKQFVHSLTNRHESREAQAMFRHAVDHLLQLSPAQLLLAKEQRLSESEILSFQGILQGLSDGKPLQYLLGEVVFDALHLKVDERVLIPRPETEELVDYVDQHLQHHFARGASVLDLGTGSGCIALGVKQRYPKAVVHGMDVSPNALELARQNAVDNQLEVDFFQGNLLTGEGLKNRGPYDLLVSNPPYVPQSEGENMAPHVLDHEPHLALFVPEDDPLIFYRRILELSESLLKEGGWVFFEIHASLGQAMVHLLETVKRWDAIELKQDLSGHDRMIWAQKNQD